MTQPISPILIVDDFKDALEIYGQYLTFKGYHVVTASNGAQAIDLARTHRPALILMDLQMAIMTGTEAMQILRTDPDFAGVPIVALTAHTLDEEQRQAREAGFDDVIAKPCLPDELIIAIERLLAGGRRSQAC